MNSTGQEQTRASVNGSAGGEPQAAETLPTTIEGALQPLPPATLKPALAAAGRVRAILAQRAAVLDLAQAHLGNLELALMETCWAIVRFHAGDMKRLDHFLADHLSDEAGQPLQIDRHPMTARMVQTFASGWEMSRRNPSLKRLGNRRPHKLLLTAGELLRASGGDIAGALDTVGDEALAEIVTMPAKKRGPRIRQLLDAEKAVRGDQNPEDLARIQQLERERDAHAARVTELEKATAGMPADVRALFDALDKATRSLVDAIPLAVAVKGRLPEHAQDRARRLCDDCCTWAEHVADALFLSVEEEPR